VLSGGTADRGGDQFQVVLAGAGDGVAEADQVTGGGTGPIMALRGARSITNIGSRAAEIGRAGGAVYSAAKAT
jgi:NAD(P)-dependent dehydrogenase (short-subunit alcohol dehydrogenase family)